MNGRDHPGARGGNKKKAESESSAPGPTLPFAVCLFNEESLTLHSDSPLEFGFGLASAASRE
jgi:hypothetical protein